MHRRPLIAALACLALSAVPTAPAQAACTRASLQSAVDRYLAAQGMGDPDSLPLAPKARYAEQDRPADLHKGILTQVLKVDYHHSLLDVKQCETFTELAVTNPAHPYVIGTHLKMDDDVITAIHSLVIDTGGSAFNAETYVKAALQEDWNVLDREHRRSRDELIATADAWLADGSNKALPTDAPVVDRRHVVDESRGALATMLTFGNTTPPAALLFRLVDGKVLGVHLLSASGGSVRQAATGL